MEDNADVQSGDEQIELLRFVYGHVKEDTNPYDSIWMERAITRMKWDRNEHENHMPKNEVDKMYGSWLYWNGSYPYRF